MVTTVYEQLTIEYHPEGSHISTPPSSALLITTIEADLLLRHKRCESITNNLQLPINFNFHITSQIPSTTTHQFSIMDFEGQLTISLYYRKPIELSRKRIIRDCLL